MDAAADEIYREVERQAEAVMQEAMIDVAQDLQKELSVPVGRDSRGRVVVRSKPGEYPRLETGRLRATVHQTVYKTPGMVHGVVSTDTSYDQFLIAIRREFDKYIESKWGPLVERRFRFAFEK